MTRRTQGYVYLIRSNTDPSASVRIVFSESRTLTGPALGKGERLNCAWYVRDIGEAKLALMSFAPPIRPGSEPGELEVDLANGHTYDTDTYDVVLAESLFELTLANLENMLIMAGIDLVSLPVIPASR